MQHNEEMLSALFADRTEVVVGRSPECELRLDHANVAQKQATLSRDADGMILTNLGSRRRVTHNGRRVPGSARLNVEDRFGIGPFLFILKPDRLIWMDNSQGIRLEARGLTQEVAVAGDRRKLILDDVSLVVEPGEFVCLIGPSGSGKSTLMEAMNGRRPARGGRMLANGADLYRHYQTFRQSQGYVPQKDIVHTQLPAARALRYTARLRLPTDSSDREVSDRVEEILQQMQLQPHRDTVVARLSGGQIKRVSLGAELLSRPPLLFIDEATSGLDPATEARMMGLFRQLAEQGKSIICITHSLESIQQCHLVAILFEGHLVYYGPPAEATGYFGVKQLHEIYDLLISPDDSFARKPGKYWAERFREHALYQEYVTERLAVQNMTITLFGESAGTKQDAEADGDFTPAGGSLSPARRLAVFTKLAGIITWPLAVLHTAWFQFKVLCTRYAELQWRDKATLRMTYLQAPVVGLILGLALMNVDARVWTKELPNLRPLTPYERNMLTTFAHFDQVRRFANTMAANSLAGTSGGRPDIPSAHEIETYVFTVKRAFGNDVRTINGMDLAKILDPGLREKLGPVTRSAIDIGFADFVVFDGIAHVPARPGKFWHAKPPPPTPSDPIAPQYQPGQQDPLPIAKPIVEVDAVEQQLEEDKNEQSNLAQAVLDADAFPLGMRYQPGLIWAMIAVLAIATFWFGCNNAAKEIVKEEAIFGRERSAGMQLIPYLASKFVILALITASQALILGLVVYGLLANVEFPKEPPPAGPMFNTRNVQLLMQFLPPDPAIAAPSADPALNPYRSPDCFFFLRRDAQFGVLALLGIAAVGAGLLISACVSTPDRASALTPYVLIPQILLCGAFIPIAAKSIEITAAIFCPVFWAYNALRCGTNWVPEMLPQYQPQGDRPLGDCLLALTLCTAALLLLTLYFLKRKEKAR